MVQDWRLKYIKWKAGWVCCPTMGGGVCEVEWGGGKHQEWKRHLKGGWYIRHTVPAGTDLVFSVRGKPYRRSQVWWPRSPQDSQRIQDSVPGFPGCSVGSS